MRRISLLVLLMLAITLFGCSLYLSSKHPSNDREWSAAQTLIPYIEKGPGETITIKNVRDWTYDATKATTEDWRTITVDPEKIKSVWFITEPFSSIKLIGHTFLSFEFEDGSTLDFSVEARREETETYSAFLGLFREYELTYQWGTERDFVTRRLVYLKHPLRMYPLTLSHEYAVALFRSLIDETDKLSQKPRFYNTLSANCTNVLAHIVNEHYPGTLPYDIAWNLTGLADTYLAREGFIALGGRTTAELRAAYDLTAHREEIATHASDPSATFSAFIRTLVAP